MLIDLTLSLSQNIIPLLVHLSYYETLRNKEVTKEKNYSTSCLPALGGS
jgi:hypothetical protein